MPGLLVFARPARMFPPGLGVGGLIEGISNCKELVRRVFSEGDDIIKA
jgi:hypothetical protein